MLTGFFRFRSPALRVGRGGIGRYFLRSFEKEDKGRLLARRPPPSQSLNIFDTPFCTFGCWFSKRMGIARQREREMISFLEEVYMGPGSSFRIS